MFFKWAFFGLKFGIFDENYSEKKKYLNNFPTAQNFWGREIHPLPMTPRCH